MSKKYHIPAQNKTGQLPGTVYFVGTHSDEVVFWRVFLFDKDQLQEESGTGPDDLLKYLNTPKKLWLDIHGLHDTKIIEAVGKHFRLHPLVLEDIVNTEHRPKAESFDTYNFVVLKMLSYQTNLQELQTEQVSIVFGSTFVITFQESKPGDSFDWVRNQLRSKKEKITTSGADFLAYSLIDVLVDDYFKVLDGLNQSIDALESNSLARTDIKFVREIFKVKQNIATIRKMAWPLREIIIALQRNENEIINKNTHIYLRDVYDHVIQIMDTLEQYREIVATSLEIYLTSTSYRLNAVMKVLTVISTIFIPLTFITSIYGMNFSHMPELEYKYGYLIVWVVMITAAAFMLFYFKKKKWF